MQKVFHSEEVVLTVVTIIERRLHQLLCQIIVLSSDEIAVRMSVGLTSHGWCVIPRCVLDLTVWRVAAGGRAI
jgi:hypothetical protein